MGKTSKMMNTWLRNCRSILAVMAVCTVEIKDIQRKRPGEKCLE